VKRLFLQDHPSFTVIDVTKHEHEDWPSSPYAEFNIKYTKVPGGDGHENIWHYWHAAEAWTGVTKETIK
jgi:hypothetical protein